MMSSHLAPRLPHLKLTDKTQMLSRTLREMDSVALGRRIKAARALAGISQKELADLIEYSDSEVGRWERGEQTPRSPIVNAIAEATGQPRIFFTNDFFGVSDPEE